MMNRQEVLDLLYEKYIAPTKCKEDLFIGVEIEIPIINLARHPVDFEVVHDLTRRFKEHFGFYVAVLDENKNASSLVNFMNDDILSYDCSYNNLEFSFGKESDLSTVQNRFTAYYRYCREALEESGHTLTGMGINPFRKYNRLEPIPNGRYRMLFHHLSDYTKYRSRIPMFFHPYPSYGMFSSASQVQLDVRYEDLIETIRAFSLLEPVKALLFSNSVLTEEREEMLCCRDMLWENSTHGINPHNIGMFDNIPGSIEELLEYFASTSIYCTEQDGKYINFEPVNIVEYFGLEEVHGEYYKDGVYHEITFQPIREDLRYLRSFKFVDLTFRGTIEFRSICCQPIPDAMSVAAFHLGLIRQARELNELLEKDTALYTHGYSATELRKLFNLRHWPEFVDQKAVRLLLTAVLTLSWDGLKARGLGEEIYLAPLFARAEKLTNPAIELLTGLEKGVSIESLIESYGRAI
ncbi:MAG: glutamylcysteine synthetase [Clostridiales Family XIII bacterium]|jgi:gamma-glutamylcysteine synthetase|nr:glutamylcysteine synthetase [Clostridiales Family XIII bacterium]